MCVCVCARACVRACVCACMCVCICLCFCQQKTLCTTLAFSVAFHHSVCLSFELPAFQLPPSCHQLMWKATKEEPRKEKEGMCAGSQREEAAEGPKI